MAGYEGLCLCNMCKAADRIFGFVQLGYSEKGYRKMAELLKTYRHALVDEEVLSTFKVCILSNSSLDLSGSMGTGHRSHIPVQQELSTSLCLMLLMLLALK